MKHLKFQKIKIAKINNLNTILGGNRQTIIDDCNEDTHYTCPVESKDPDKCVTTTNEGTKTLSDGIVVETNGCG